MEKIHHHTLRHAFPPRAPRYTSYPPANRFGNDITTGRYTSWLEALPTDAPGSLYLHIPFCKRLCWFCACRTQGVTTQAPILRYLEALRREAAAIADRLPDGFSFDKIHFGGGTPTILTAEQSTALLNTIRNVLPIADNADLSVEIDPTDFDQERADALLAAGLSRASIGIQDFAPDVQAAIGRTQDYDITQAAFAMLREGGVPSINADVVYGLPLQTRESFERTIARLMWLRPDRVALFGYAHVPQMSRRQRVIDGDTLPDAEQRIDLFDDADSALRSRGYVPIGFDHYALPGDSMAKAAANGQLRRNFQGYTDDVSDVLIGLGASAISRLPQGYAQNAPATSAYLGRIESGDMAAARGLAFSRQDKWRGHAIERLMCDFAIDFDAPEIRANATDAEIEQALAAFAAFDAEAVSVVGAKVSIAEPYRSYVRNFAGVLDEDDPSQASSLSI
ncbi:MAG: oxygen-independent coproporphyrinogen III oxidase [Pikeienuella sp.]